MKPLVIDASAVAPWFIPDERTAVSERLYSDVRTGDSATWAPALWLWETRSILLVSFRRGRVDAAGVERGMTLLDQCQVQLDAVPDAHRRAQTMRLAQVHALSYCDAAYLELALRLNGQLASADRRLVEAAKGCGIPCIEL